MAKKATKKPKTPRRLKADVDLQAALERADKAEAEVEQLRARVKTLEETVGTTTAALPPASDLRVRAAHERKRRIGWP